MEKDNDALVYGAVGAAIGIGLSHYAKCYLLRERGRAACRRFIWMGNACAASFVLLFIAGFIWLPDLPVSVQNLAAISWMTDLAILFCAPFVPACVYARRESRYRRATRGPLAGRLYADLHQYFPRSLP